MSTNTDGPDNGKFFDQIAAAPQQPYYTEKDMLEVVGERDRYHEVADSLANSIAEYFGVEIGEHSSANCPWDNALEVIRNKEPPEDSMNKVYASGYAVGRNQSTHPSPEEIRNATLKEIKDICNGRADSLRKSGMHSAANEARKCAVAIARLKSQPAQPVATSCPECKGAGTVPCFAENSNEMDKMMCGSCGGDGELSVDDDQSSDSQAEPKDAENADLPIPPSNDIIAEQWVIASDVDGIAYDGPSFERGYKIGEIAERDSQAEPSGMERDAERYRRLRRWKGQEHEPPFCVHHEADGIIFGPDLDDAIDAVISAKQEKS